MRLAREGIREIALATLVLGGGAAVLIWQWHWAAAIPLAAVWVWVIAFFRDPPRRALLADGEFCAPADGTVTEVTRLEHHDLVGGPAVRIGIFLSIFDVHINRSPCDGRVRSIEHTPGRFLDARHPESGARNEACTLVLDRARAGRGPVVVRQVAGKIARRIICHATPGVDLARGERFGMIKFGSRTELIVGDDEHLEVTVEVGRRVRAGLSILARQADGPEGSDATDSQTRSARAPAPA